MRTYLKWLRKAMGQLDKRYAVLTHEPMLVEEVFSYAGSIAEKAGQRALKLGLPALHDESLRLIGPSAPPVVATFLARCIAECKSKSGQEGPAATDRPLTVAEAAAEVGIGLSTMYSLCERGEIEHFRIGKGRGTIRINKNALVTLQRRGASKASGKGSRLTLAEALA